MKFSYIIILLFLSIQAHGQPTKQVYINGEVISSSTIKELHQAYNINIQPGKYWYDNICGAWGIEGGPTLGFVMPYIKIGGRLKENASNGNTGVWVNGRQLHQYDVIQLRKITNVLPGRYWLDAYGNAGYEGGPAILNLVEISRRSNSTFFRNSYTGIGGGSSGGTSYVIGKDISVIVGN
ncbi:MAG: hypothetical protein KTR13_00320 [Saprospiraceae bacterium]|nr:hypothetical protein [Saprospiraceae bacterium]